MILNRSSLLAGAALLVGLAACEPDYTEAGLAPPASDSASDPATGPGASTQAALVDLRSVDDPNALDEADVRDRLGQSVGSVESVEMAADGSVEAVVIALDEGGPTVRATPMQARFDERGDAVALLVNIEQLGRAG